MKCSLILGYLEVEYEHMAPILFKTAFKMASRLAVQTLFSMKIQKK